MITNFHRSPRKPARAVVLGAGGFIGGAIARALNACAARVSQRLGAPRALAPE